MAELILEYSTSITTADGQRFIPRTYGQERPDGTWIGWLEFTPTDRKGPALRTERETTQPNKFALEYWASGLEPIYFEGAFERAQRLLRSATSASEGTKSVQAPANQ